jgi:hypothetical protein
MEDKKMIMEEKKKKERKNKRGEKGGVKFFEISEMGEPVK